MRDKLFSLYSTRYSEFILLEEVQNDCISLHEKVVTSEQWDDEWSKKVEQKLTMIVIF